MRLLDVIEKSLRNMDISREEALAVLGWPEGDILALVSDVFKVREAYFGRKVKLNFLANIQSGICPEDCSYCSQSRVSKAPVEKYKLISAADMMRMADQAVANKASRLCMVASMKGPSDRDIESVSDAVRAVKEKYPDLEICNSLGFLKDGQAEKLKQAGVMAYNHNLNTGEKYYGKICHTHTYKDREDTVNRAFFEGLSPCSGALFGMGESQDDILDVTFRLREMKVSSIPINFFIPIQGTILADKLLSPSPRPPSTLPDPTCLADSPTEGRGRKESDLTPVYALKILCLFRLVCPDRELRIAGGRELHLRTLQPLALYIANSIFIGDYLTTKGQDMCQDLEMIQDMGFEVLAGNSRKQADLDLSRRVSIKDKKSTAPTSLKSMGKKD